jgi:hypothetical protein
MWNKTVVCVTFQSAMPVFVRRDWENMEIFSWKAGRKNWARDIPNRGRRANSSTAFTEMYINLEKYVIH